MARYSQTRYPLHPVWMGIETPGDKAPWHRETETGPCNRPTAAVCCAEAVEVTRWATRIHAEDIEGAGPEPRTVLGAFQCWLGMMGSAEARRISLAHQLPVSQALSDLQYCTFTQPFLSLVAHMLASKRDNKRSAISELGNTEPLWQNTHWRLRHRATEVVH